MAAYATTDLDIGEKSVPTTIGPLDRSEPMFIRTLSPHRTTLE
jgi:hypothetical protein